MLPLDFPDYGSSDDDSIYASDDDILHIFGAQDLVRRTIFYIFPYLYQQCPMKIYPFTALDNPKLAASNSLQQFRPQPDHEFETNPLEFLVDLYNHIFGLNDSGRLSERQYLFMLQASVPQNLWTTPRVQAAPARRRIAALLSVSYTMDMRARDFQAFALNVNLQDRFADEFQRLSAHMWAASTVGRMELDLMKVTREFREEMAAKLPTYFDRSTGLVSERLRGLERQARVLDNADAKTLLESLYAVFRQTYRYLSYKHSVAGAAFLAQALIPETLTPPSPGGFLGNTQFSSTSSSTNSSRNLPGFPRTGIKTPPIPEHASAALRTPGSRDEDNGFENNNGNGDGNSYPEPGYNLCYCNCNCSCNNSGRSSSSSSSSTNTSGKRKKTPSRNSAPSSVTTTAVPTPVLATSSFSSSSSSSSSSSHAATAFSTRQHGITMAKKTRAENHTSSASSSMNSGSRSDNANSRYHRYDWGAVTIATAAATTVASASRSNNGNNSTNSRSNTNGASSTTTTSINSTSRSALAPSSSLGLEPYYVATSAAGMPSGKEATPRHLRDDLGP